MSKEHPILFSGPMVRAILDGKKTQTRRIVKPQPTAEVLWDDKEGAWYREEPEHYNGHDRQFALMTCPYGSPGDRLWVRETWNGIQEWTEHGKRLRDNLGRKPIHGDILAYKATAKFPDEITWRPSIFMPRWASRITLEIVSVKVERLQDISEEDAKAEGLATVTKDGTLWKWGIPDSDGLPGNDNTGWHWHEWERDPRAAYRKLWESINGPGSWDANPWVWVVEFKKAVPLVVNSDRTDEMLDEIAEGRVFPNV